MPNIFSLLSTAWDYDRSQPVLHEVRFWLLALPVAMMGVLGVFQERIVELFGVAMPEWATLVVLFVAQILLTIVTIWGTGCVLLVGRKLVQSRAGRVRSSFAAVRQEAAGYVGRLVLTNILRDCITILWGLLLIVPGVIYSIRTVFYPVVIFDEESGYRDALNRSKQIVKGHTWMVLFSLLGMGIVTFTPPLAVMLLAGIAAKTLHTSDVVVDLFINGIVVPLVFSPAITLFTLSTMVLYAAVKKLPKHEEKPPAVFTEVRPE